MSLLVLAYPDFSIHDFQWIQSIRSAHDQRHYSLVKPHFTIVFPVSTIEKYKFCRHVEERTRQFGNIFFSLRRAICVKDSLSDFTDIFLIPDEGNSYIRQLHDTLYTDILSQELRLDIPFIPHIGVGGYPSLLRCNEVADQLNGNPFCIHGQIHCLDIVEYDFKSIVTIHKIDLVAL